MAPAIEIREPTQRNNIMSNKVSKIIVTDSEGNKGELGLKEYQAHVASQIEVEDFNSDKMGDISPSEVIKYVVKTLSSGGQIEEEISNKYPELIELVTSDIEETLGQKVDKKAEAEKKAAEKAAAEKEKAAIALKNQEVFVSGVASGADLAQTEFSQELSAFKDSLPEGFSVVAKGDGFGLDVSAETSKEVLGQGLGYLIQKSANSTFIGNQLAFWIGDLVSRTVEIGLFETAKEAATSISSMLLDKHGKTLTIGNIDAFKRMSERTPIELRNPIADATAYLAISNMKIPRKGEKETEDKYKARLDKFEKDRLEVQKKVASGEVTKRGDVLPLVEDVLVKHGLKEKKEENPIIASQQAIIFFHASIALDELLGTHEEDAVVYRDGEKLHSIPKEELERIRDEAKSHLVNIFYSNKKAGLSFKDFVNGYTQEVKKVVVGKDGNGKNITQDENARTKVYPAPFFEIESEETETQEGQTEEASA